MLAFKSFLAVVPPDIQITAAIRRAAELAQTMQGTLHLCAFVHDGLIDWARETAWTNDYSRARYLLEFEPRLQKLAAAVARPGLKIQCEVLWAPVPDEAIIAKALDLEIDCVVKDVRRESVLRRALFTPLDWKLIRLLPTDLMLVGPNSTPKVQRLLAAVDVLASDTNDGALNGTIVRTAAALATATGARMDVASVAPWFPVNPRSGLRPDREYEQVLSNHFESFRTFTNRLGIAFDRRHRLLGVPSDSISELAEEISVDITVVGNAYRSRWDRLLLGSTAELLLQQLKCDLLVVKNPDFMRESSKHIDFEAARRRFVDMQPVRTLVELG